MVEAIKLHQLFVKAFKKFHLITERFRKVEIKTPILEYGIHQSKDNPRSGERIGRGLKPTSASIRGPQ